MKTVGIIGGFGPETTAQFQLEVIKACRPMNQNMRPSMITWNAPIPIKTETELILRHQSLDQFLPFLISGAKLLEKAGADFLVLPCNTLHLLFDELKLVSNLPILHIVEETSKSLQRQHCKTVGLLATTKSIQSGLHKQIFDRCAIKTEFPSTADQIKIDKAIQAIINNKFDESIKTTLMYSIHQFHQKKIVDIVLGCTDLQSVIPNNIDHIHIHDSMKILAQATADEMNKE